MFLTVFLLASIFALTIPNVSAVNIAGSNQYYLWGGFTDEDWNHVESTYYVHNGTVCTPYYNGSYQVGGTVYVDSHYMDYTFYGNITYADLTLFQGEYTVYLGQQSNLISYAIDFSSNYIWDSGSITLEDMYYSGYSGPADPNVFSWFSNLPPFSTTQGTTYMGIKYNFVNATAGVNYNVIYLMVIDGYLGQDAFGTPTASFSPDWGSSELIDLIANPWLLVAFIVGLCISVIGLVVLMKASGAWMAGLFLVAFGFILTLAAWTSLYALVGWALCVIISPIFLYSGGRGSNR